MIQSIAVPVAGALDPILSVFRAVGQQPLRSVRLEEDQNRVIFDFERGELVVQADPDDDSIEVRFVNQGETENTQALLVGHLDPWAPFIGKPFGWGWITVNQQGYCDGLLLSFDGIDPQLLLIVAASALVVSTVTRLELTKST